MATTTTTERLPIAALHDARRLSRAARMVRLAQRAQRAGNTTRAHALAAAARTTAGLAPLSN